MKIFNVRKAGKFKRAVGQEGSAGNLSALLNSFHLTDLEKLKILGAASTVKREKRIRWVG